MTTALARIGDTLTNLVAHLATGKSKAAADRFGFRTLDDAELEAMYRGDWVARKAVDIPVNDMLRPWRSWQASADQITAIEAAEKRHDVRRKIARALRWARLYGGAAIIIGDGSPNPELPLAPETIKKGGLKYLTVLPRRNVTTTDIELDPANPYFGEPKSYQISGVTGTIVTIHPSRVIRILGNEAPGIENEQARQGWADSVLQAIYDALHHVALASGAGAEMIHEAKLDIISVPDLGAMLSTPEGTNSLTRRFQNANMLKSINNMLLLDQNEKYDRKQTSFAGVTDVVRMYLQIVAGATDIPATRLLGQTPGGLNASGDSDTRNYYDMLDGQRHDVLRPILERLDPILWRDQTGAIPADAWFEFGPLWQPTAQEKATTAKTKAETTKLYHDMGLIPDDFLAIGVANQLIEDGVYPGAEEQLATVRSAANGLEQDEAENDNAGPAGADGFR